MARLVPYVLLRRVQNISPLPNHWLLQRPSPPPSWWRHGFGMLQSVRAYVCQGQNLGICLTENEENELLTCQPTMVHRMFFPTRDERFMRFFGRLQVWSFWHSSYHSYGAFVPLLWCESTRAPATETNIWTSSHRARGGVWSHPVSGCSGHP